MTPRDNASSAARRSACSASTTDATRASSSAISRSRRAPHHDNQTRRNKLTTYRSNRANRSTSTRSHPLRVLLDDAARGQLPTASQLDAALDHTAAGSTIELTADARRSMRATLVTAASRAVELKSEGANA